MFKSFHKNYSVSDEGEIRNDRTQKILKPYENSKGYLRVKIDGNNLFVHRIVLETFEGKRKNKQVNHKDYNRQNNKLSNLEWMTAKENAKHRRKKKTWDTKPYTEEELEKLSEWYDKKLKQLQDA